MKKNTTKTVDEVSGILIEGNIISPMWYKNLRHQTKRGNYPHLLAINILGDVVYWYRSTTVRDEKTGQISEIRKKFAADKLQRSYSQICEYFGCSPEQAKEAVKFLEDKGLVKREFRTIVHAGQKYGNVMFLDLIPDMLRKYTLEPLASIDPLRVNSPIPSKLTHPTPPGEFTHTNTETSTETSTDNYLYVEPDDSTPEPSMPSSSDLEKLDARLSGKKMEYRAAVIEIVDYFREVTGKKQVNYSTKGALNLMTYWLKEGYTVEDFKLVIDFKTNYFRSREMHDNINLDTFCRQTKFEDNLEKAKAIEEKLGERKDELNDCELTKDEMAAYVAYEKWLNATYPEVTKRLRFFSHSEFRKYLSKDFYPMAHMHYTPKGFLSAITCGYKLLTRDVWRAKEYENVFDFLCRWMMADGRTAGSAGWKGILEIEQKRKLKAA